ncbi:MAG: hypothetical protein ABI885_05570 [Gammaproteobacteria bacterium]
MSGIGKASNGAERVTDAKATDARRGPTVTASGQIMWSSRDLLFPSGHAARRAAVKAGKK